MSEKSICVRMCERYITMLDEVLKPTIWELFEDDTSKGHTQENE